ncbi:MAG TPA: protein-disulfide reductase DsbD domain-containing protein [Candidatus Binataceae bacterium]
MNLASTPISARIPDAIAHTVCVLARCAMALVVLALTISHSSEAATHFEGTPVVVKAEDVQAQITLSADHSYSGRELGVAVDFKIAPGWHIYGAPLPEGEGLTSTSINFASDILARQTLALPKPIMRRFETLNQTYPVYTGTFTAFGTVVLSNDVKPGDYSIPGTLSFQQCNDAMCKMPQTVHFELPIKIEPSTSPAPTT